MQNLVTCFLLIMKTNIWFMDEWNIPYREVRELEYAFHGIISCKPYMQELIMEEKTPANIQKDMENPPWK